ncbi:MAG: amidohydrolase family protein, partial [Euryarchaeota archaeon]|nr:amidohydrolase family protein [Euryarchaeota archaeon]MBV1768071.1 amidohydrolase family protein [Methanobacterium sp.]
MEKEIGTIQVGKKADLALINIKSSHLTPFRHPVSHLVYSAQGGDVDTVICNGSILMENQDLQIIEEQQVLELAENAAEEMLSKN